jgi:hypothetical protein
MDNTDISKGSAWVEEQVRRLADDMELNITSLSWSQSGPDRDRSVHTLALRVNDTDIEEKFASENLARLKKDRRVRAQIEHRLKAMFRSCGFLLNEEEDDVVDETEKEDRGIEFKYSITSYGADYPVDGLIKRLSSDPPDIFIPPFQRRFVWSKYQSSRFIESLLLGLPVPAIFLGKEEDTNRLLVIDGQQRLTSLWHFYRGKFEDDAEFVLGGVASRFEGVSYRTLNEADRRRLDDSILHAIIVRQDEPKQDNNSSIYLLFERLNTGGSLLHPQEIRACVYHGPFNDLLAELNQDPSWRAIYGPENQRMKDRELILRFFTLVFDLDKYEKPMEGALNHYMGSNRKLQRQSRDQLINEFLPLVRMVNDTLGTEAFRPIRAINAAVFDSVMVALSRRIAERGPIDADQLKMAYAALLADPEFQAAYSKSTSNEDQVKNRITIATKHISRAS